MNPPSCFILVLLASISIDATRSDKNDVPSARELLRTQLATLGHDTTFVTVVEARGFEEADGQVRELGYHCEYARDGDRRAEQILTTYLSSDFGWQPIKPRSMPAGVRQYYHSIAEDQRIISYQEASGGAAVALIDTRRPAKGSYLDFSDEASHAVLRGFVNGDSVRVAETMLDDPNLKVRPVPEPVDGVACWVVEASLASGRYVVWLDAQRGALPLRVEVRRDWNSQYYDLPLWRALRQRRGEDNGDTPAPEDEECRQVLTVHNVDIVESGGAWLLNSCTYVIQFTDRRGRSKTFSLEVDRVAHDGSPDLASRFHCEIPDGTPVTLAPETDGLPREWRAGSVRVAAPPAVVQAIDDQLASLDIETASTAASPLPAPEARRGVRLTLLFATPVLGVLVVIMLLYSWRLYQKRDRCR